MKRQRNEQLRAVVWLYAGIALLSFQVFEIPNADVDLFGRKISIGWVAVLMAAYNGALWLLRETERHLENVLKADDRRQNGNKTDEAEVVRDDYVEEKLSKFDEDEAEDGAVTIAGDIDEEFSVDEDAGAFEVPEEQTEVEGENDDSQ